VSVHDSLDLASVVKFVEFFPDYLLPQNIAFEMPNERKLIKAYRYYYKGIKIWLEHLVLKERLNPEATDTDWKYFQPHAQIKAALLDLATGVHACSWIGDDHDYFESPLIMWGNLLAIQAREALFESLGLTGIPALQGKVEFAEHNLLLLKKFDETEPGRGLLQVCPIEQQPSNSTLDWNCDAETYLISLASDIAKNDSDFDKAYWIPFRSSYSLWTRKIRDCEQLHTACLLPNGDLFMTQKGQKLPKQLRSKRVLVDTPRFKKTGILKSASRLA